MRRRLYLVIILPLLLAATEQTCAAETMPAGHVPQGGPPASPVSPSAYHAVGDGIADDTDAVSAWLNSGRPLVCAGTFRILKPIVVSAKAGLYLQGLGAQGCRLELGAPSATLTLRLANAPAISASGPEIVIHDVMFAIDAVIPSAALRIDAPATVDRIERGADLRDISFAPEDAGKSARTCLELTDIVNVTISGLNCRGRGNGYAAQSSGILIDGTHIPGEIIIRDADIYLVETGFRLEGSWQGVAIESSVCVGCRVGVRGDGGHDGNENWLRVLNSHFNVYDYGVFATNIFFNEIRGNLTFLNSSTAPRYPHDDPETPACYHFDMPTPTGSATAIRDNICDGHQRSPKHGITRYGVFIDGFAGSSTSQTDIRTENIFQNLDVGTMLGPNARGVIVGPDIAVGVTVPKKSLAPPGANAAVAPVPF